MKKFFLSYLSYQVEKHFSKKSVNSYLFPIFLLGRLLLFILPNTYLSYLFSLGRLVSLGNFSVSNQMPMYRHFGNLGNIFQQKLFRKFLLPTSAFLLLYSCSPIYPITQEEIRELDKYPLHIHRAMGIPSYKTEAYRLYKIDSIRQEQEEDLRQEYLFD